MTIIVKLLTSMSKRQLVSLLTNREYDCLDKDQHMLYVKLHGTLVQMAS